MLQPWVCIADLGQAMSSYVKLSQISNAIATNHRFAVSGGRMAVDVLSPPARGACRCMLQLWHHTDWCWWKALRNYTHIVLDEIHERDLDMDPMAVLPSNYPAATQLMRCFPKRGPFMSTPEANFGKESKLAASLKNLQISYQRKLNDGFFLWVWIWTWRLPQWPANAHHSLRRLVLMSATVDATQWCPQRVATTLHTTGQRHPPWSL